MKTKTKNRLVLIYFVVLLSSCFLLCKADSLSESVQKSYFECVKLKKVFENLDCEKVLKQEEHSTKENAQSKGRLLKLSKRVLQSLVKVEDTITEEQRNLSKLQTEVKSIKEMVQGEFVSLNKENKVKAAFAPNFDTGSLNEEMGSIDVENSGKTKSQNSQSKEFDLDKLRNLSSLGNLNKLKSTQSSFLQSDISSILTNSSHSNLQDKYNQPGTETNTAYSSSQTSKTKDSSESSMKEKNVFSNMDIEELMKKFNLKKNNDNEHSSISKKTEKEKALRLNTERDSNTEKQKEKENLSFKDLEKQLKDLQNMKL
mmetsp:Transcript_4453/g.4614  ORF Transcript_4453/g.4614 Transcript_4453/m.4614 type:complete len:314 (-) Transcript_4453:11-952(-)